MSIKDVVVNISRETTAVTQAGFGLPLIISTEAVQAYGEYSTMAAVTEDYASNLKANKMAEMVLGQTPALPKIAMVGISEDSTAEMVAELNEMVGMYNDFFFVLADTRVLEEQKAISTWAAANGKMYFTAVNDLANVDAFNSVYTVVMAHDAATAYPDAGWVGVCAPKNPGSITWKFKNINGLAAAKYSLAEISQIHAANANTYVRKLGYLQTSAGKTSGGEYIDNIRGEHFIKARMEEEVSRLLFANDKVPYTDQGIALVADAVRTILRQATVRGVIATDDTNKGMFTVTVPNRADVAKNDVANRVLKDVHWTATLAGAVEQVQINGVLTY